MCDFAKLLEATFMDDVRKKYKVNMHNILYTMHSTQNDDIEENDFSNLETVQIKESVVDGDKFFRKMKSRYPDLTGLLDVVITWVRKEIPDHSKKAS